MNSTDGYFDVTANKTKIVTVPDGYEIRFHKINDIENNFPDGINTKDIKDLDGTLAIDLSTPSTIDLKGTLLSNGQPIPTMDEIDTEIEEKITALNLSGTYATITSLNTVKATADAAAPKSTTYTKTEVDASLNSKANSIDVYTKTDCDGKFATITSLNAVKTTADNAAPQSTTYTKTESDNKYVLKAEQSITSTTDKVQICSASQQVADVFAVTVVNGGLIFQTDGKVFIGVNDTWVQLGVPIS